MPAHHPSDRASFYFSKEGTTSWSSFFKPDGFVLNTVTVPAQWVDFFTAKLLTPKDFDWAKNLLQSRIWQILSEMDAPTDNDPGAFVLPRQCPSQNPPVCTLSLASTEATQGFLTPQAPRRVTKEQTHSSTSALLKKKRKSKLPLDCSKVRRSNRIKSLHKGYKARTWFDKNCRACAVVAPLSRSQLSRTSVQNSTFLKRMRMRLIHKMITQLCQLGASRTTTKEMLMQTRKRTQRRSGFVSFCP
jgi:hypothetical protein